MCVFQIGIHQSDGNHSVQSSAAHSSVFLITKIVKEMQISWLLINGRVSLQVMASLQSDYVEFQANSTRSIGFKLKLSILRTVQQDE